MTLRSMIRRAGPSGSRSTANPGDPGSTAAAAGLGLPARLRRVELAVGRRIVGRRDGRHASLVLGHGVEPGEARPYEPGDDVRRMDWSILARTGEPYVRDAVAERDLDVAVLVDRSGSLDFGTASWRKADLAVAVAAAVAGLAVAGGDRVGAVVAGANGTRVVPVRGGRAHVVGLIGSATRAPLGGAVELDIAIDALSRVLRRRGLAVVVSDFLGPTDRWPGAIARLARRNDVIAVEVVDPRELRLPDVGLLTVEDPETGRQRTIDTADERFRIALATAADRRRAETASAIRRAGATHLRLRTDGDWVAPLAMCLDRRRRERSLGRRAAGSSLSVVGATTERIAPVTGATR
jgi:uncharacterized protein (DUF58 family)